MDIFDDCEPVDWELTDEELGITPAIIARSARRQTTSAKVGRKIRSKRR